MLIVALYIFNFDKVILRKVSSITTNIQDNYIYIVDSIDNYISSHFNQQKTIEKLKYEISQNIKYKIMYLKNNNNKGKNFNRYTLDTIKVISYANFDNFSKIILQTPKQNIGTISALITDDGYSAGIAIYQKKQMVGLLNNNKNANYAVFIGENLVPGITHGNYPEENITIKYIPSWKNIKINDEVITSGMDNIFYKGVKVGYVTKIIQKGTTQEAIVKPYAKVYDDDLFYVYSKK
jgi:rod shape-determining protein MreC